jgi:hypothetical protein
MLEPELSANSSYQIQSVEWRIFRSNGICEPPIEFLYQGSKVLFLGLAFWNKQAKCMRFYD